MSFKGLENSETGDVYDYEIQGTPFEIRAYTNGELSAITKLPYFENEERSAGTSGDSLCGLQ